jgi:hypothetical protein
LSIFVSRYIHTKFSINDSPTARLADNSDQHQIPGVVGPILEQGGISLSHLISDIKSNGRLFFDH